MTIKDLWYWFKHWLLGHYYLVLDWNGEYKSYHYISIDITGKRPPMFNMGGEWRELGEALDSEYYYGIIGLDYDPH